ncbi:MAG TPA: hypothetical protein VFJ85_02070 [Acidimicrobiales bacterium]|nr:hypothetical protein [Acidimicrobiales bacterium]
MARALHRGERTLTIVAALLVAIMLFVVVTADRAGGATPVPGAHPAAVVAPPIE